MHEGITPRTLSADRSTPSEPRATVLCYVTAMPFEVMLRGTHPGRPSERRDPFTGASTVVVPLEMTDAELSAALDVIRRHGGTSESGIRLADASLSWVDLDREGTLVGLRGNVDAWARVLFELADAGNLAILSCAAAPLAVTSDATLARIRARSEVADELDDETAVVVHDAAALASHLATDVRDATSDD